MAKKKQGAPQFAASDLMPKWKKREESEEGEEDGKDEGAVDISPAVIEPVSLKVDGAEERESEGWANKKRKLEETVRQPSFEIESAVDIEAVESEHEKEKEEQDLGKGKEKRRPHNVTILPHASSIQTPTGSISSLAKNVLRAAEAYIQWYEHNPSNTLLNTDSDSESRFDAVIKHLSSIRHDPSLFIPISSPYEPSSPNSPRTPIPQTPLTRPLSPPPDYNPELADLYTACQAYVDSYIVNNPPSHTTPIIMANLHLDILEWRNQIMVSAHGKYYLLISQNWNMNRGIYILLERMFKGFAKYHPFLKKNIALVDGQVVDTDEVSGIEGFEVIKETVKRWVKKILPDVELPAVKLGLPDWRKDGLTWMKLGLVALFVRALWVSAYFLLVFWTPIAWQYAVHGSSPPIHRPSLSNSVRTSPGIRIPGLNINIHPPQYLLSPAHSFENQLHSFEKNLNTTEKYYQKATDNAVAAVEEILEKTETLVLDVRHVAFARLWKGIGVLGPVYWAFGVGAEGNGDDEVGEEGVRSLAKAYFRNVKKVRRGLEGEKRVLSYALGKLEEKFEGLMKATEGSGKVTSNPLKSHGAHPHGKHLPTALEDFKKRHETQGKLAKEHLFVLYEDIEGFVEKVKGEIEGGEVKGWWLAIGELRKALKGLRGRVGELGELVKETVEKGVWEDEEREAVGEEADKDAGE